MPEPEPIPRRQTRASRGRGRRANEPVVPPAPEPPIPEEEEIAAAPEVPEPEPAVPGAPDEGAALSVPSSSLPDEEILAARYAQGRESFRRQVSERASSLRREIEEGSPAEVVEEGWADEPGASEEEEGPVSAAPPAQEPQVEIGSSSPDAGGSRGDSYCCASRGARRGAFLGCGRKS